VLALAPVTSSHRSALTLALPLLLAVVAYLPIWDAGFAFDDPVAIERNPLVNGEVPAGNAFSTNFWGNQPGYEHLESWRPLTVLALRIDYGAGDGSPTPLHAMNLLWHLLFVAVVWWTALARGLPLALTGALAGFAALAGSNAEAVSSIVARGDLMAATLSGLGAALLIDPEAPRKRVIAGLILMALALMSKETAVLVVLPTIAVAGVQGRWAVGGSVMLVSVVWYIVRAAALGDVGGDIPAADNPLVQASAGERITAGLGIIGRYVGWTLLAQQPAADYTATVPLGSVGFMVVGIVSLMGTALVAWRWRRSPMVLLGAFVVAVATLLLSNLVVTLPAPVAGRYGPWWTLAAAWMALGVATAEAGWRRPLTIGASLVALAGAPTAFLVSAAWEGDAALFAHSVDVEPDSARAWVNLGAAQQRAAKFDGARESYKNALKRVPDYYEALYRLADLERDHGKNPLLAWKLGEAALKAAKTDNGGARRSLCATRLEGGGPRMHRDVVLKFCLDATKGDTSPQGMLLRARALHRAGRISDAGPAFEAMMKAHPNFEDGVGHFIGYLAQIKQLTRAIELQKRMLESKPNDEVRKRNMVALLFLRAERELMQSKFDVACATAREAEKLSSAQPVKDRVLKFCGPKR